MNNKNIWVLFELSEGAPKRVCLEMMHKAAGLAKEQQQEAVAVIIDPEPEAAITAAFAAGAHSVIALRQPSSFEGDAYILQKLMDKYAPAAVFIGTSNKGRDISAALSARCQIGIACDCTDVMFSGDGISWIRPSYDGRLYSNISISTMPQIGTFSTGTLPLPTETARAEGPVVWEDISIPPALLLTRILGFTPDSELAMANLEEADIIVSGGKGVGSQEGFKQLFELASVLGGSVGASRAAVEEGWIGKDYQIGATGKTVRPKLYLALGISGAVPHVAGMKDSDVIVAVNTDPNAPIFDISHFGIVGDLHKVVPVLIKAFREAKG